MAFDQRNLEDYVDVAERITEFYDRYPDGSLSAGPDCWRIVQAEGYDREGKHLGMQTFIAYMAHAYRTPDDPRPGVGCAWEPFPGRTPYTRGSELMNAETSAWGRALAALGIATKRGIASRQEVAGARERADGLPVNRDGSLSRSRTTDEEKAAAGVMTSGQLAEHTALQPKRADQGKPAGRLAAVPDDDPFYDQTPAPWPPGPTGDSKLPEDEPGSRSRQQLLAVQAGFTKLAQDMKIPPKDARSWRLAQLSLLCGREIGSANDLSWREAEVVLAGLDKAGKDKT